MESTRTKSLMNFSYEPVHMATDEVVRICSTEVAEMLETQHKTLLSKIDSINQVFTGQKILPSEYWIEGLYTDSTNRKLRCFYISKEGCEFLSHKSTGDKGIIFTHRYMTRFRQMENTLQNPYMHLSKELQAIFMLDQKHNDLSYKVLEIENKMTVNYELSENLRTNISARAIEILNGKGSVAYKKVSKKVFTALHRDLKKYFKVNSYKNLSVKRYDEAMDYIRSWNPETNLKLEIELINRQSYEI